MYENLGDMLNQALETGRLPPGRRQARRDSRARLSRPAPEYLARDFSLLGFDDPQNPPAKAECARAYHRLVKARHPDSSGGESAPGLTEAVEAYRRLSAWYESL
jgi:hypothetical protein